jgi:hypothetical protein
MSSRGRHLGQGGGGPQQPYATGQHTVPATPAAPGGPGGAHSTTLRHWSDTQYTLDDHVIIGMFCFIRSLHTYTLPVPWFNVCSGVLSHLLTCYYKTCDIF